MRAASEPATSDAAPSASSAANSPRNPASMSANSGRVPLPAARTAACGPIMKAGVSSQNTAKPAGTESVKAIAKSKTRCSIISCSGAARRTRKPSSSQRTPSPADTRLALTSGGPRRRRAAGAAQSEDVAEVLGVVHLHELARARQVLVVQAREPEAQRGRAQQRWPGGALALFERPQLVVGAEQSAAARLVEPPVRGRVPQAPVVDAD